MEAREFWKRVAALAMLLFLVTFAADLVDAARTSPLPGYKHLLPATVLGLLTIIALSIPAVLVFLAMRVFGRKIGAEDRTQYFYALVVLFSLGIAGSIAKVFSGY